MANPVGNELVAVIGVSATGGPSAVTEYFTTSQIGGAGFLSLHGIVHRPLPKHRQFPSRRKNQKPLSLKTNMAMLEPTT